MLVDGLYVQFSTITHQEIVFLGEVTIPMDHLYLEGSVLIKDTIVNQLCFYVHTNSALAGSAERSNCSTRYVPCDYSLTRNHRGI